MDGLAADHLERFQLLEALFALRPFAAGDHFSMADIPLAVEMHRWSGLPWERQRRPHVEAWYGRVKARPAAAGLLDVPLA